MTAGPVFRSARRRTFASVWLVLVATLAVLPKPAAAQPLVDRVPADAIVYVGWLGYDAESPGFKGSHLKAVLDLAEFRKLVDDTLPKLADLLGREDRDAAQALSALRPLLVPMLKHPTAVFVGTPDLPQGGQPTPKAGIVCQAGPDAAALLQHVQTLLANAPDPVRQMVRASKSGETVVVSIGYAEGAVPAANAGASVAGSPGVVGVRPHLVKDASFVAYADAEKFVALADQAVKQFGPPPAQDAWPKVRDAVGLKGVKRFVWSSGFDGKEWADMFFLAAPEPRPGLLALADPTPLSDAAYKSIPATATMAGASKLNLSQLLAGLRTAVGQVEPRAAEEWDKAFAEANRRLGLDLQRDVIAALGDEWAYYVDPNTGGRTPGGIVFLNRLKDPAKAEAAFAKLERLVNDELAKNIHEKNVSLKFLTTQAGGTTIHYLGTPLISPSWAVKEGHLVVALFPQMVAGALDQIGGGAAMAGGRKSILDNPDFAALRKRLGVTAANGFAWSDLPKTAPDSYASWVAVSRLANFADVFGVPAPAMLLPPLGKLMPHLSPAGSVTWTDKDGIHAKMLSPFPGATVLAADPLSSTQSAPFLASVLLPSLNRAREQANRVKSASNLRQIGIAGIMYANENKGRFPATMGELFRKSELTAEVAVNPRVNTGPAPRFADPVQAAKWVEANGGYVWIGGGLKTTEGPDTIIGYEKEDGLTEGLNLLFADCHVEWYAMDAAREKINAQRTKRGLPPLP
ncbi:MAG: hypothetical protein JWO31_282 [Phycisphaerales bacterium]|nr:hypothetical protein [Phycisphaerales bacterium]